MKRLAEKRRERREHDRFRAEGRMLQGMHDAPAMQMRVWEDDAAASVTSLWMTTRTRRRLAKRERDANGWRKR